MLAKLKQIGYSDVADQMLSGLDFGDPQVQGMITQLGTIEPDTFTPERVEILKSWGVERRPRWTLEGFASQPTLAEIEKRKAQEAESVHRQKAKVAGVRFGDQMPIDGDAREVMAQIWSTL
jgi:hypothetical protein